MIVKNQIRSNQSISKDYNIKPRSYNNSIIKFMVETIAELVPESG